MAEAPEMTWKEVVSSEHYKNLPVEQRIRVADSFFSSKVAPELSEEDLEKGREKFYEGVVKSDPKITEQNIGELESASIADYLKSPKGQRLAIEVVGGIAGGGTGKLITKGGSRLANLLGETTGVAGGSAGGSYVAELVDPTEQPHRTAGRAAVFGATGEVGGRLLGRLFLGPAKGSKQLEEGAREAVEQLSPSSALPTPGQLSTNTVVDASEQIAEGSFLGGKRILETRERAGEFAQAHIGGFVNKLLQGVRGQEAGKLAQMSIQGNTDMFKATAQGLFRKVDDLVEDISVPSEPIRKRASDLKKQLTKGLPKQTKAAQGVVDDVLDRTAEGPISFEEAQAMRSDLLAIGRTDDPISGKAEAMAKQLAKEIDRTMQEAAEQANPRAFKMFRRANQYWKKGSETFNSQVIKKIAKSEPEEVGRILSQADKPSTVAKVRAALRKDRETWDRVRGNVLRKWLEKAGDPQTDVLQAKQALKAMKNYGQDSLDTLLSKEEQTQFRQLLNTLALTQTKASQAGGFDVFIKLAQGSAFTDLLTLQFMDPATSSLIAFGPEGLARLLSNPKVVKRLTVGLKAPRGSREARRAFTQTASMLADTPGVQITNVSDDEKTAREGMR